MRDSLPLQIADIIAYESKKEFERQLNKQKVKPRWGFRQLEKLITLPRGNKAISFGSENCSIALLSKNELTHISNEQRRIYDGK